MSSRLLHSPARAWQLGVLALVAAWVAVTALPELPFTRLLTLGRPGTEGLFVVPALIAAALVLRPAERTLHVAAAIVGIVLAGALLIPYAVSSPEIVAVAPGLVAASLLCARWPVAAVTAVALLAGFHGTIEAHTAIPPRIVADGLLAGIILSTAWRLALRGRSRPAVVTGPVVLLVVYVAASLIAAIGAPNIEAGLQAFRASQFYLLAAIVIGFAGWDAARRRRLLNGLLLANLAVTGYAVFRWIAGPTPEEAANALASLGAFNLLDGQLRLIGSFPAGSDLAGWTVITVPLCAAMTLALRDRWRWVAAAGATMGVAVMLETGVRVAAVGVLPAVLVVIFLYALGTSFGPRRLMVAYAATALIVVGGGSAFAATILSDPSARERYTRLLNPGEDPSFKARTVKWEAALRDIESQPFGLGLATGGTTAYLYGRFITAGSTSIDSSYLKVAIEQGFFVLALLLAGLVWLMVDAARRAIHGRDPTDAGILVALVGGLTGWLVIFYAGNFIEQQASLNGYLLIALGLSVLADPERA